MKIVSVVYYTPKNGKEVHHQETTYGGAEAVHAAKSKAGKTFKFYATRVQVTVNGEIVFKGSKSKGLLKNKPSDSFK